MDHSDCKKELEAGSVNFGECYGVESLSSSMGIVHSLISSQFFHPFNGGLF